MNRMTTTIDTEFPRRDTPAKSSSSRLAIGLLMLLSCVAVVVGYTVLLHAMLGDDKTPTTDLEITVVRVQESDADRLESEHAAIRQRARDFDEKLLRERELRKYFRQQNAPDAREADRHWKQQVAEIESEIDEALKALPEGEEVNPGSILWHRKRDLERLMEDAPRS